MATTADTIRFLQRVPLFQGLNNRQLGKLAERCIERKYAAGQSMVTQGYGAEGFYVIVSGKAEAIRERVDGEKVVVNTFGPTDFFGELALLDEGPRTATVIANEATECLALTSWDFLAILKGDADMAVTILLELARRFRMALDRLQ
jgi:CRP/FNR family cyclic AMP-dependent transcriptional regulator